MANKPNPLTPYIVRSSKVNGYTYAHVQKLVEIAKKGTKERRKVNIGKLIDGYKFVPNKEYRLMPVAERRKLRFPPEWDISAAQKLDGGPSKPIFDENDGESPGISTETVDIQSENGTEETKNHENGNNEQNAADVTTSDENEQYEPGEKLNLLKKADKC